MPAAVWTTFAPSCAIDNALNWAASSSVTHVDQYGWGASVQLDWWDLCRGALRINPQLFALSGSSFL